jgi:uncharacterized membrane protein YcaP (DUF421 family)
MEVLRTLIGPDDGEAGAAQLCVRAVIVLLFGILCIRVSGRRTFSLTSPLDILVATIAGSNLSRAMTGRSPFIAGLAATFALVVLHRTLAWASLRSPWISKLVKLGPVVLAENGQPNKKLLRRECLSDSDLLESLRMEGVEDLKNTKLVVLEGGGKISVVRGSVDGTGCLFPGAS